MILRHNARLLQQILLDLGALDNPISTKMDVYVFAKPKANETKQNKRVIKTIAFSKLLYLP